MFSWGCCNLAAHIKALDAKTTFISVLGEDETGNKITKYLVKKILTIKLYMTLLVQRHSKNDIL